MIPFLDPITLLQLQVPDQGTLDGTSIADAIGEMEAHMQSNGGTMNYQGQQLPAPVARKAVARLQDPAHWSYFCALHRTPHLRSFLMNPTLDTLRDHLHHIGGNQDVYLFFRVDLLRCWNFLRESTLHAHDWKGCHLLLKRPAWLDQDDFDQALLPVQQAIEAGYAHWGKLAVANKSQVPRLLNTHYLRSDLTRLVEAFPYLDASFRIQWAEQMLAAAMQLHRLTYHVQALKASEQVREMAVDGATRQRAHSIYNRIWEETPAMDRPREGTMTLFQELRQSVSIWIWPLIGGLLWLIFGFETC